jgi:hypothetical protein
MDLNRNAGSARSRFDKSSKTVESSKSELTIPLEISSRKAGLHGLW